MTQENTNVLARIDHQEQNALMTVSDVSARLDAVHELMKAAMKDGEDFGVIPGTGGKPTLLKPGSEKLCTLFRLSPTYQKEIIPLPEVGKGHREYILTCTLTHIPTGRVWGQAVGSCSTAESKYRYRKGDGENTGRPVPKEFWDAKQKDPAAAQQLIGGKGFRTKKVDGQWLIFKDTGDRVDNPDIADQYNTVLKMATKRALVAAVLITTGASALFTQDMDEDPAGDDSAHDNRHQSQGNVKKQQTTQEPKAQQKQQTSSQEAAPQANPTSGNFEDRITNIKLAGKSQAGATRPWTRWEISVAGGGPALTTFSETTKDLAEKAMAEDETVRIVWEDKGRGANVTAIESVNAPMEGELVG
jgi:hypothetical protein